MHKKLILACATLFLLLFLPKSAFAQSSSLNITLSPVYFDLTANPGDTLSEKIRVRSNTSSTLPLNIVVKKNWS